MLIKNYKIFMIVLKNSIITIKNFYIPFIKSYVEFSLIKFGKFLYF